MTSMKVKFTNIASLIEAKRKEKRYTQTQVSHMLGYTNGQFISNISRALCSVPKKTLPKICEVLDITKEEISHALVEDFKLDIESRF